MEFYFKLIFLNDIVDCILEEIHVSHPVWKRAFELGGRTWAKGLSVTCLGVN